MKRTPFRLGAVAALLAALTAYPYPAHSEEQVTPSIPCDGSSSKNVKDLTFQFRSAVLTAMSYGPTLRVTLGITNGNTVPVGVFVEGNETSASTDTGLAFLPTTVSGMSICSPAREYCTTHGTLTTIGAGASTSIILYFQSQQRVDEENKRVVAQARSLDLAAIIFAVIGNEKGFLPISCVGMPLRNMAAQ